jgi:glycerate dehydrogenase
MRIVYLDSYMLNPGDLDWRGLETLGECTFYDRTLPTETIARARDAEIILTNKVAFDRATIEALPRLRYIGITATGHNIIDLNAAKARGVVVSNVPDYSTESVAQMVFALLLELSYHTARHDAGVHAGKWSANKDFSYWEKPLIELADLTMGIVGFGHIGQAVAKLAYAFGMKVLVSTRTRRAAPKDMPVECVALDELFKHADVVSLHCPLTPETKGLADARRLALMKNSAFFINTARGALVEEEALAAALNEGRIAGAGLDVLSVEPPPADHPLLKARNCIITPHIAWATVAARKRLLTIVTENVRAFLNGQPANVVNS